MASAAAEAIAFTPGLVCAEPAAGYWLRQVTLRLRREVCWRWHQQGQDGAAAKTLAPGDPLMTSLDLTRYWDDKRGFFETDVTAGYLSDKLAATAPAPDRRARRGSFDWLAATLELDEASAFALALALAPSFDSAVGPVIAACLDLSGQARPTLALAQRLWDRPDQVLPLADPNHPLWRHGLLQQPGGAGEWDAPFILAPLVARQILDPDAALPDGLAPLAAGDGATLDPAARLVAERLETPPARGLRVLPIHGATGAAFDDFAGQLAAGSGREVRKLDLAPAQADDTANLKALATVAWLRGLDLFMTSGQLPARAEPGHGKVLPDLSAMVSLPITLYLALEDRGDLAGLPRNHLEPLIQGPALTFQGRVETWTGLLGTRARGLEPAIAECARRFRYETATIKAVCDGLGKLPTADDLVALCRAQVPLDVGELAQAVVPRFTEEELVLPAKQRRQFREVRQAMTALTEVHYGWGTARAWNDGGISVLFAGPPGTGKTMAAEVLARALDMPLYRIDLSQVVNKYIGETEKNLKRLFDLADIADTILFFDEADALFGKRSEVKDAHDRYANLEISYLLERMERFKGLAILATNRRRDLDDAFLRRLRYIIEFPLPDGPERKAIWQRMIPEAVDASALDFDFLAQRFQLAGGHIRSIVFNACLQAAGAGEGTGARALTMEQVIVAVKREYDKLNRSVSTEQFGPYGELVEGLDRDDP
jgi:hypothetical protein